MLPALEKLQEKIDSRVLRERVILFVTALAVVFMLWNLAVQSRFDLKTKALRADIDKVAAERKQTEAQITAFVMATASDPAVAKKKEIESLKKQVAEVETKLSGLSQGLISAEELPKILEEVLLRTASMNILKVKTLPASELMLTTVDTTAPDDTKAIQQGTGVYKHAVSLKISGSYLQLVQLLTAIEALEWKFYWEGLDYKVTQYPEAEIIIRVFTLSSDEGLLGV